MTLNRRDFTLTSLSALGALAMNPTLDNFRLEKVAVPQVGDGQVLLRTQFLSLDPYMRGRMNAGKSYAPQAFLGLFSGANFGKLVVRVN
jgi:NADPH-dependent curcumin reductase CurA